MTLEQADALAQLEYLGSSMFELGLEPNDGPKSRSNGRRQALK